jgi:hypothetical protein
MKSIIRITALALILSFKAQSQEKSLVLGIPMTEEQDLAFDYYSSFLTTLGMSQLFDKITHHKRPVLCGVASMLLNSGVVLLERGTYGKVVRSSGIVGGFLIHITINHVREDKILRAKEMYGN